MTTKRKTNYPEGIPFSNNLCPFYLNDDNPVFCHCGNPSKKANTPGEYACKAAYRRPTITGHEYACLRIPTPYNHIHGKGGEV